MDNPRSISVMVHGRLHTVTYKIDGDWVEVTANGEIRRVSSRLFDPEELARIIAIGMLADKPDPEPGG